MVCKVADNPPLKKLRNDLGFKPVCHSFRASCIHRLPTPSKDYNLGGPGAAIGYCQALFNKVGSPHENTNNVVSLLQEIGAPWAKSHELFWGYKGESSTEEYVVDASGPLIGDGRVPILITALNAGSDQAEISKILSAPTSVVPGETILLRILIDDVDSAKAAVVQMRILIARARNENQMPQWWPLIQGALTVNEWREVQLMAGEMWPYFNIAATPWTSSAAYNLIKDQITVAQVPVGLKEGISLDGTVVMVDKHIKLPGTPETDAVYNLLEYFETLKNSVSAPTLIVLGPSKPEWTEEINKARLQALLPLLEDGCKNLWDGLAKSDYETVWSYVA
jgi:hypothetical protein